MQVQLNVNANILKSVTLPQLHLAFPWQVYSWGDNTFGQLAHIDSIITRPKKIKVRD